MAEWHLLGPLWAGLGYGPLFTLVLVAECLLAIAGARLIARRSRLRSFVWRWMVSGSLAIAGVLAFNLVVNVVVLVMIARAARGPW